MISEVITDIVVGLMVVLPLIAGFTFIPNFMLILVLAVATLFVAGMIGNIIRG